MPTGYTAKLYEGEPQTFEEFVVDAARAFFYDMDALPDKFEPSDYPSARLAECEKELGALLLRSETSLQALVEAEYEEAQAAYDEAIEREQARLERYTEMLEKVRAWTPPSDKHQALKDFMIEQLESSIKHDTGYTRSVPYQKTTDEYLARQIDDLTRNIEYYKKKVEEENARAKERTEWVQLLRGSLKKGS